jgi:hypothetical protein
MTPGPAPNAAYVAADPRLEVPELSRGLAARLGRRHALALELLDAHLEVQAQLVVDVAADARGTA